MIDRRTVLRTGIVLPAASLAAAVAATLQLGYAAPGLLSLERFVYDVRFAEPFDIAAHAGRLGVPLSPISDDLMDLWYNELDLRWQQEPTALAGVTTTDALFVLETLAMDRRMRVVYRGEHGVVEDGRITNKLWGPREMIERFASATPPTDWEAELALAMTECPLGKLAAIEVQFDTSAPGLSLRDVPLVSWIIAPQSAVALMTGR